MAAHTSAGFHVRHRLSRPPMKSVCALGLRCTIMAAVSFLVCRLLVVGYRGVLPLAFLCVLVGRSPAITALLRGGLSGVVTSRDDRDFEAGRAAWGPGDGGLPSAAGFVVGGEVAEEGVAGLQVSARHHQTKAVAGAEEGGRGAERDED